MPDELWFQVPCRGKCTHPACGHIKADHSRRKPKWRRSDERTPERRHRDRMLAVAIQRCLRYGGIPCIACGGSLDGEIKDSSGDVLPVCGSDCLGEVDWAARVLAVRDRVVSSGEAPW